MYIINLPFVSPIEVVFVKVQKLRSREGHGRHHRRKALFNFIISCDVWESIVEPMGGNTHEGGRDGGGRSGIN